MSWKGFLKLDKRKIVVFVIIIIIKLFLFSFSMLTGVLNIQRGEPGYEEYQRAMTEQKIAWIILTILDWPILIPVIGLILDVIWLYLLSCLIIWIYNKVKKK